MKKHISKINKYLLEHYPTIWNTRLVWMLSISIIIHLLFFIGGLLSLVNPASLHNRRAIDLFFDSGLYNFGILISIIMLVVWLIFLFKNNSFKSFYPNTRLQIFQHFVIYFVIIFFSTSFYFSFTLGIKLYIDSSYETETIQEEITLANNTALFFSHGIDQYKIGNRKHPRPFDSIFCETRSAYIKDDSLTFKFLSDTYQFYSLRTEIINNEKDNYYYGNSTEDYVYRKTNDSLTTYFFKDSIIDIRKHIETVAPSYYNHSKTFYNSNKDIYHEDYLYTTDYGLFDFDDNDKRLIRSRINNELLKRNNPNEIKAMLSDFLQILNLYKVEHNISADEWFQLIYKPDNFEINSFIRSSKPLPYERDFIYDASERTELEKFVAKNTTDYYMETSSLYNAFDNIEEIKSKNIFEDIIHFYCWFAFILASLIFIFRITGLRPFIFSVIVVTVLMTITALLATVVFQATNDDFGIYFIEYFILIIGTIILAIPIFYAEHVKKGIVAVCLNISIVGFLLYVLLIIGIISTHQANYCDTLSIEERVDCFILIESLGIYTSYILFVLGFIFLFFYSRIIKNWKALPEQ
ncbi:hypothetical protein [Winogradskyella sp. 3972H.M.0a.05]|uniref:hypothetical protein n=1 Tax=Winogradskyella sp. 3972H.M.0a.05 TaxID=2950277 RepID=UPI003396CFB7